MNTHLLCAAFWSLAALVKAAGLSADPLSNEPWSESLQEPLPKQSNEPLTTGEKDVSLRTGGTPGRRGIILPPETGIYLGQTELSPGDIANFERAIGRNVAIAADLSVMRGQEEAGEGLHFNLNRARQYWERGAVVLVGAYEAYPGHKPFTVDRLLRGAYDEDLKELAAQFRAFGKPMFFCAAREPNGVLAPFSGGFGPEGDQNVGWAERTGRFSGEFHLPAPPEDNPDLYAGLGNPTVNDGLERLAAAQRYYYDFFVRREGLTFLTFETMGWAVPTWESEPGPIADFDQFYPLVADYSDWISVNFYMMTEPVNEDTGQRIPEPPIGHYLKALDRVMQQVQRLAPNKPVLITELGFGEPNRVEKIEQGLTHIITRYPQVKGLIHWGGDLAIRPGTPAAEALLGVVRSNPSRFHSTVRIAQADQPSAFVQSAGEYLGRSWHIDENQLLWWNRKPYVRFGFTGAGNPEQMLQAGFDQFTLAPAEEWPIYGPDPKIVQSVNETSDQLEAAGATYYGTLNAFWPWRYGDLIAKSDCAPVFAREVRDVTEQAGKRVSLDLEVRLPIHPAERDRVAPERTQAVLFDLEHGTSHDLSDQVASVVPTVAKRDTESTRESDAERHGGMAFRVRFKPVRFPESASLRLVLAMEVRLAELPGVNGLVPLWQPGIREFYSRSLEAFRPAYAKPGLRGLQFGDEINTFPMSLLTARTYWDVRRDPLALTAYRDWLARRFGRVEELNRQVGTKHTSFDQVEWCVPLHPFSPELARSDDAAEREESWAGAKTAWGLAETVEALRTISRLQDDFRIWFFGHWLAEYAKQAKAVIGNVPVFVCSAAIGGEADQYLAMHRWALREGVDGLIRNHYGHGGEEERHTLANLARWMAKVQPESGCTKHLWANEVGYVRPGITDDDWAAAEATELSAGGSFGSQWAFPSQEALREMLELLTQYGYRGFNRFLMNPSAPRADREVEWMAQLRPEITSLVVKAQESQPAAARLTREQVIAVARKDRRVQELLRDPKAAHAAAEFSKGWNVWLVRFSVDGHYVGFASVSPTGKVLEVGEAE